MKKNTSTGTDGVTEYIAQFPPPVRSKLEQIRKTIRQTDPGMEETISYGMPAYKLQGILVYFAGYKNHIGFYPTGSGINAFKDEIQAYKWSKGTVQFPIDQPLPLALIKKIVTYRISENKRLSKRERK
ncbi:MAG: hypothetical protein GC171_07850 [Terrimonas sp.]|nr:hypothetical protein [Terrimonas sp.]